MLFCFYYLLFKLFWKAMRVSEVFCWGLMPPLSMCVDVEILGGKALNLRKQYILIILTAFLHELGTSLVHPELPFPDSLHFLPTQLRNKIFCHFFPVYEMSLIWQVFIFIIFIFFLIKLPCSFLSDFILHKLAIFSLYLQAIQNLKILLHILNVGVSCIRLAHSLGRLCVHNLQIFRVANIRIHVFNIVWSLHLMVWKNPLGNRLFYHGLVLRLLYLIVLIMKQIIILLKVIIIWIL